MSLTHLAHRGVEICSWRRKEPTRAQRSIFQSSALRPQAKVLTSVKHRKHIARTHVSMATANGGRAAETAERDQLAASNAAGGDAEMAVSSNAPLPPSCHPGGFPTCVSVPNLHVLSTFRRMSFILLANVCVCCPFLYRITTTRQPTTTSIHMPTSVRCLLRPSLLSVISPALLPRLGSPGL